MLGIFSLGRRFVNVPEDVVESSGTSVKRRPRAF